METLSTPSSRVSNHPDQARERFQLLLVHDGFQNLDQLIDDLQTRDLPAEAEVLLLSVSDLFRTPLHLVGRGSAATEERHVTARHLRARPKKTRMFFDRLESVQRQARAKLQAAFPDWQISLEKPLDWQPNLIFLGACHTSSANNPGLSEIVRRIAAESAVTLIVAGQESQGRSTRPAVMFEFDGPARKSGTEPAAGMASSL